MTVYLIKNKEASMLLALVFVTLLTLLAFILIRLALKSTNEKVIKVVDKVDKALLFSMFLRTMLAVYIDLCITAFEGYFEGKISPLNYLFTALVISFCLATLIVPIKPGPEYL